MGNTFSCVSGKSADDSPKKAKNPKDTKGLPLPCSKPRVVKVTEDSIIISWDKPTYDGGNAIFGYSVKMGRDGQSGWRKMTAECNECMYTATGLEPDVLYKFFVQAENDNGLSKPSEVSDPIRTLALKVEPPAEPATVEVDKGDENKNEAEVSTEFGASAEKYVVKDDEEKKSRKSSSSSSDAEAGEDTAKVEVNTEVKEEGTVNEKVGEVVKEEVRTEVRTVTTETKVVTVVTEEKKAEEELEVKTDNTEEVAATVVKSESKESVKSSSSSSSSDGEKKSNKSAEEVKNDIAKAASAGVSVEADFSANGSSVGHGTGILSTFLDSRLYQYSNDSLLDDENEEDQDVKTKNRVNKNMDIQKHDKRYFIEIETVDATGNVDDQFDERDRYIHTQVPMIEPVEFDGDESCRLSIISERSMEDNLSPCSPDTKAKDGHHFVFSKKEVAVNGSKSEAGVSRIPSLGSKIPYKRQEPLIINTVPAEIQKPEPKAPAQPESRIPPPQIKATSSGKAAQDTGTRLPTLGTSYGSKVENEERMSPRDETERRSSIPMMSSSKVETKITPPSMPSAIPRRGSAPKTSIPLKKDSSGENINVTLSGSSPGSEESKIPTGIPRRKSVEKPDTSSKITPPSARTGIPRGTSGIRPPGSFSFQARVDASS